MSLAIESRLILAEVGLRCSELSDLVWKRKWVIVGGVIVVRYVPRVCKEVLPLWWVGVERCWRWCIDSVISLFSTRVNAQRRHLFNTKLHLRVGPVKVGHSHALSAAVRSGCSHSIDNYIVATGGEVYTVSRSNRDEARGDRLYYHVRDYAMPAQCDAVGAFDIIKMVDVDYYAPMDYWISFGKPIVCYTFVPQRVAGFVPDATYWFHGDEVQMQVNGGARYRHSLWDYDHDYVTVDTVFGVWVVAIDQVFAPEDQCRRVVQLTPLSWIPFPLSVLVKRNPLKRRQLQKASGWLSLISQDPTGRQHISVAKSGHTTCCTMPLDLFDAIVIRHRYSKSNRNIADIERFFRQHSYFQGVDAAIQAALLFEFLEDNQQLNYKLQTVSAGLAPPNYQTLRPLVTEDGKMVARKVGPQILDSGVFPAISYNNDTATVAGRVDAVRNTTVPPRRYFQYAYEFVRAVPLAQGSRWTVAQVMDQMDEPLQKKRAEREKMWVHITRKLLVKSFQKRESYQKITDPRNISTVSTSHTLELSTFTYPFKYGFLKQYDWYMPGSTPSEIADRIMGVCATSPTILETDYSRLDGTISGFLKEQVQDACYLRYFGGDADLLRLLQAEGSAKAVTRNQVWYEPGSSRLSGSPLTTDGNTLVCAFVAYCAYRDANYTHEEAMAMPALVYGDDGLWGNLEPERAIRAASDLGLTLKINVRAVGEPVGFLGRVFQDPWTTPSSYQDVKRTMSKIHTTTVSAQEASGELALTWKAAAYLVTDSKTPLIANYCNMVFRVLRRNPDDEDWQLINAPRVFRKDFPYFLREKTEPWYQDDDHELRWRQVAAQLDVDVAYLQSVCQRLDHANTFDQVPLGAFQHIVAPVEIEAVVTERQGVQEPIAPVEAPTQGDNPQPPQTIKRRRRKRPERRSDSVASIVMTPLI